MTLEPVERADLLDVLLDHLDRPVEHAQHIAALRRAAPRRLAIAHPQRPVGTERRTMRVRREIRHIEPRSLLAAHSPRIDRLEQRRVTERRERALAPPCPPVRYPRVTVIEEHDQLL